MGVCWQQGEGGGERACVGSRGRACDDGTLGIG